MANGKIVKYIYPFNSSLLQKYLFEGALENQYS